ncbi:unnamed protein product [Aphanomyces euteiches]|uniref:N-acetyltransferase domain-containing protein n=1 Tax=Aphanomyces euteiches TaxID=100861 RepID=A0A6G0X2S3_9STRA|nr:hypothetical protein Ae201684_009035 [Aphanomyces euteiches]KAH9073722.1 hypothetical protein Ae201684P_003225 [Aphanomyces euteiches]KAH9134749.1 hypothetical protein AeRB84_019555 [Aphanomyces euteiches]
MDRRVVALHEHYDRSLLDQFYSDVLLPCFGMYPDELDDLDALHVQLNEHNHDTTAEYLYHVLLLLQDKTIVAGVCFEYYRRSICGLVTHIATNPKVDTRGQGVGKTLAGHAVHQLHRQARKHGHDACQAVFLESNRDQVEGDVMQPARRRQIFRAWGIQYLDFDYIQPRLSDDKEPCRTLYLGVWKDALVQQTDESAVLPSRILRDFLTDFFTVLIGTDGVETDVDAVRQLQWLDSHPVVPLLHV